MFERIFGKRMTTEEMMKDVRLADEAYREAGAMNRKLGRLMSASYRVLSKYLPPDQFAMAMEELEDEMRYQERMQEADK